MNDVKTDANNLWHGNVVFFLGETFSIKFLYVNQTVITNVFAKVWPAFEILNRRGGLGWGWAPVK